MPHRRLFPVLVPLALALSAFAAAACGAGGASSTVPPALVTGEWGGDHAGLIATSGGGTMEYDCATGFITEPIRPSPDGGISVTGTHTPGHGGPVRIDEVLPQRPARYTGRVDGEHLTLTVVMTDSNVTVGTFELYHGRSARVFKCL